MSAKIYFLLVQQITLKDIDFKSRDKDDLQFKEDEGIYPPHFRVVIDATCTIEKATAHLKFSGTANDLVFDMHLVPPTLTIGDLLSCIIYTYICMYVL